MSVYALVLAVLVFAPIVGQLGIEIFAPNSRFATGGDDE